MNNIISELEKTIEKQKKENISLYKKFEYKLWEDEMQPYIKKWREGSKKLQNLIVQLNNLKNLKKFIKEEVCVDFYYIEVTDENNLSCEFYLTLNDEQEIRDVSEEHGLTGQLSCDITRICFSTADVQCEHSNDNDLTLLIDMLNDSRCDKYFDTISEETIVIDEDEEENEEEYY